MATPKAEADQVIRIMEELLVRGIRLRSVTVGGTTVNVHSFDKEKVGDPVDDAGQTQTQRSYAERLAERKAPR